VIPATVRHLPGTRKYPPTMIAAFGLAEELEPGVLSMGNAGVRTTHLTRLLPDGSDRMRTGDADKLTLGLPRGVPLVLAPVNDGLGLAITEGIEDGLSVFAATELGVWAAGSASLMPSLAEAVPPYVETITIYRHADTAGLRGADELTRGLHARGFEVRPRTVR
jgi:Toprim domain